MVFCAQNNNMMHPQKISLFLLIFVFSGIIILSWTYDAVIQMSNFLGKYVNEKIGEILYDVICMKFKIELIIFLS